MALPFLLTYAIFSKWLILPEFLYRLTSQVSIDLVLQFTRRFNQGVILGSLAGVRFPKINFNFRMANF
jgi:hypothetical protein